MLTEPLPATLDVRKAAAREVTVEGLLDLSALARLQGALASNEGRVEAKIAFARDEENRFIATINIDARVEVLCQRCLDKMTSEVRSSNVLAIVGNDELAGQLPAQLEPWVVEGEQADLWQLVEDELILAIPIVSYHETADCNELLREYQQPPEDPVEAADNPFKVLEQLKSSDT